MNAKRLKSRFLSVVIEPREDEVTILDPSKIVAVQWKEHDDQSPHILFLEGGHTFAVSDAEFERLAEVCKKCFGIDLGWISGLCDSGAEMM